jgi:hypothetical protein
VKTGEANDFFGEEAGLVSPRFTSPKLGEGAFIKVDFSLLERQFTYYGVELTPRFVNAPNPNSSLDALQRSMT